MSNYQQGNILVATFDLWISGTEMEMSKKECITSIDIKETVEGADTATIQISDPEFKYLEDNLFLEDNSIKIRLNWNNTTTKVEFDGYISAIDIDFANDGIPVITLSCMDKTHLMNRQKNDRTYNNCTNADVIRDIVAQYGYSCVVESGYDFKSQETITQSKQTDIEFLTKLAGDEVYPFTARLVDNTFYYTKIGNLTTPKMTLTYKNFPHEIISFSPKINKETKQIEVSNSSMETSDKSVSTTSGSTSTGSGSASSGSNSSTKTTTSSASSSTKTHTYNPATKKWS